MKPRGSAKTVKWAKDRNRNLLREQSISLDLVHPSFRRFHQSREDVRRSRHRLPSCVCHVRIQHSYSPFPRIPPFHCEKCTYSTYCPRKLKWHPCCSRRHPPQFTDIDQAMVDLGHRNKCRDALAMLERCHRPQKFRPSTVTCVEMDSIQSPYYLLHRHHLEEKREQNGNDRLSSSENGNLRMDYGSESHEDLIPMNKVLRTVLSDRPYPDNVNHTTQCFYCCKCKTVYYGKKSYEEHLEDTACKYSQTMDPIPVKVKCDGNVPVEYEYGRSAWNFTITSRRNVKCKRCSVSSLTFATDGDFHDHLLKCAAEELEDMTMKILLDEKSLDERSVSASGNGIDDSHPVCSEWMFL